MKGVNITYAEMVRGSMFVASTEYNPFSSGMSFRGCVGRLAWNEENKNYFVGFFETKEEAKNAYLDLVEKLIKDLASKIQKI